MKETKLGKLAEQVLVESASAGSPEAMTELVQLHSGQIYQISLKILKNRGDAEDNLQDVLCKVCANIHRFEGRSRFSTWLFRITINEALMRIRGRRSRSLTIETDLAGLESDISAAPDIKDTGPDQERRYIAKELAAKAFQGLPPSLVDMYIRHKTEGWTQRELAAEAGVTLASVKSRMFVVRGRMQERLQGLC